MSVIADCARPFFFQLIEIFCPTTKKLKSVKCNYQYMQYGPTNVEFLDPLPILGGKKIQVQREKYVIKAGCLTF